MNKKIRTVLFVLILLGFGTLVYGIFTIKNQKEALAQKLQSIPHFTLPTVTGNVVSEKTLLGKKSILIYYAINCSFCEAEATQIGKNLDKLQSYNIVMISENEEAEVRKFREDYNLYGSHIFLVKDVDKTFYNTYGIKGTPTIFLYDELGQFIYKFNGSVHIDKILEHLTATI